MFAYAGAGVPLLLLHGFPQTHFCWRAVIPALAESHTVVAPDLRGYGGSRAPAGGPGGEGFTKREMAAELVGLMGALGFDRFAVVGHDRGARVAYRMALDHPTRVERLAVLNIVPTVDQFERMAGGPSLGYWPWFLLAQPAPFPERLIAAAPDQFLRFIFDSWTLNASPIDAEAFAVYLDAFSAAADAICADYRASFWLDREHDDADRLNGRRIGCPTLVITGADETQLADAGDVWRAWAADLRAATVPGGHFIPEEAPQALAAELAAFLATGSNQPTQGLDAVSVRRAAAADARAIAAVFDAAVRAGWTFLGDLVAEPLFTAEDWNQLMADHEPPNVLLVAVDDTGTIVGFTAVHPEDGEMFLLFVHPGHAGRGVGRRLLDAAHDALRTAGCSEAFLFVHEQNERAVAVYTAAGYRPDGSDRVSDFRGTRIRELRLVKQLDASTGAPPTDDFGGIAES